MILSNAVIGLVLPLPWREDLGVFHHFHVYILKIQHSPSLCFLTPSRLSSKDSGVIPYQNSNFDFKFISRRLLQEAMGRGWELLLTNMPGTPLQEGRRGEGVEHKNVFPNWNPSGCGVKAVSPMGACGCLCRALVALVFHHHSHNRDSLPTGPAFRSGSWFSVALLLTDSLLGFPHPSQQLF